jgi:hypothetical protein
MKLTDLAFKNTSKSTVGVMENQFGKKLAITNLDAARARTMLEQVSRTIGEYRKQPNFHNSQRSPAYLKAVMLEQALKQRVQEALTPGQAAALSQLAHPGKSSAAPSSQDKKDAEAIMALIKGQPGTTAATGGISLGEEYDEDAVMELMAMAEQDMEEGMSCSVREINDRVNEAAERDGGQLHLRVYPQAERKVAVKRIVESGVYQIKRTLREASEVETAQVVLAAQDMADRMQKMIEQTSEMLYKELPALTDSIKYELSTEKAQAFNQTAAAGLQGLLESLQASKGQMDTALAGLTGQAMGSELAPAAGDIAGADIGAELGAEMGADLGAAAGDELAAVDMPPPEEEVDVELGTEKSLGRARK